MIITKEQLIKDTKGRKAIAPLLLFTTVGFGIPLAPLVLFNKIGLQNALISAVFLGAIFGTFFGYYIGLRNLLHMHKISSAVKNDKFHIIIDEINDISTEMWRDYADSISDKYAYANLKMNREITIMLVNKELDKVKKGDQCILVMVDGIKDAVKTYLGNEYRLDENLQSYVK